MKPFLIITWLCFINLIYSAPIRGRIIVEGDILITKNIAKVMLGDEDRKRKAAKSDVLRWHDGVVPYLVSPQLEPYKDLLTEAFRTYQKHTCIKFRPVKPQDTDYVKFTRNDGCYSAIGRQGGVQEISLGDGCQTLSHVLHEIMHALGFFHEQSRFDRGLYVKILWWNIANEAFKNFAFYDHGTLDTLGAPYDKHSILHYGQTAFSKNGGHTIESIDNPNEELGRDTLSIIDIQQINTLYRC